MAQDPVWRESGHDGFAVSLPEERLTRGAGDVVSLSVGFRYAKKGKYSLESMWHLVMPAIMRDLP
jgi:hypothetical protein